MSHPRPRTFAALPGAIAALLLLSACAGLGGALGVTPPSFELVPDRPSRLGLELPSFARPRGAATVVLWARVRNPNAFGFTLSTLRRELSLEGREMADVDLPLGIPLAARGDTVVPLEIRFPIPPLDQLGSLGEALLEGRPVRYALDGTVGVDAGPLGRPTFGPRSWLEGEIAVRPSGGSAFGLDVESRDVQVQRVVHP